MDIVHVEMAVCGDTAGLIRAPRRGASESILASLWIDLATGQSGCASILASFWG
jgi:hypothetical protein